MKPDVGYQWFRCIACSILASGFGPVFHTVAQLPRLHALCHLAIDGLAI